MKIQCPCGAKYVIDVTPGMASVQFVCQNCGQDYSAFVNDMIRRELGEQLPVAEKAPSPAAPPPPPVASAPPVPSQSSGLRISRSHAPEAQPPSETPAAAHCLKHNLPANEHCFVCKKPICPRCMEIFGYFCSAFCKNKAEAQKMNAPVFAGQKFEAEKRYWRKMGLIGGVIGGLAVLGIGFWTWYAWFAAVPHSVFSVRFDQISHSGGSYVTDGQIVFLHGGTLARYDLKTKKEIWSDQLVSQKQIDDEVKLEDEEAAKEREENGPDGYSHYELPRLHQKRVRIALESELSLHVSGQNIWIAKSDALTHYDWNTGKVLQTVPLTNSFEDFTDHGNELVAVEQTAAGTSVTHISMDNGEMHTEEIQGPAGGVAVAQNSKQPGTQTGGGLPLSPYDTSSKPLNPNKVATQAQNLTPAGRAALPAVMANNSYERRIEAQLNDGQNSGSRRTAATPQPTPAEDFMLIPDGTGYVKFAARMIKANFVQHEAMKAPPKTSALDTVTPMNESAAVNEQLNEMQRNSGNDKVTEDLSTYQVTFRNSSGDEWTGDVTGPPQLFPLKTINVLTAGKTVMVFDKSNKKLWQAQLTYEVPDAGGDFLDKSSSLGEGPCAEHGDTLYVYDQAVLTAFDLKTGDARWRIPSVGVHGLFFDDQGMLYVNTTTGNPDDIKYSRQIDINKSTQGVFAKIDPKTGKILWTTNPHGSICYMSGQYIYSMYSFDPGDEEDIQDSATAGLENPPFLRISRISPKNGRILWEYTQGRAPVDVQFNKNSIRIVFKKEVEVLRYLVL